MSSYFYRLRGQVQGVGMRPHIYRLAVMYGMRGWVRNTSMGVELALEGESIEAFWEHFEATLPPLARVDHRDVYSRDEVLDEGFVILESVREQDHVDALIAPDVATCAMCYHEVMELKTSRYHRYFLTNCTHCGPRYSIIRGFPYDRALTSMAPFALCPACDACYHDPLDRRYHAQPIACPECGPQLRLWPHQEGDPIVLLAHAIRAGKIVAVQGIGGFHLMCDATHSEAIMRLRALKNRPSKPFAIMAGTVQQLTEWVDLDPPSIDVLSSSHAPILIVPKRRIDTLIAPDSDRLGCMLAYTPLHHLLFEHLEHPIIATSANLGDEPIVTNGTHLRQKLPFVEMILDFDREIVNAIDDTLVQWIDHRLQVLRLARGYAPKVFTLPSPVALPILAVGAHQKNTFALGFGSMMIVSPHIGEVGSVEGEEFFERTLATFERLYDCKPELIISDMHPEYTTTRWAARQHVPWITLQHHRAHLYACRAEYGLMDGMYCGFIFDGTGYGEDGTLWGGEVFVGEERRYFFDPIPLLGGEKAIKEPRRVALSLLFARYDLETITRMPLACVESLDPVTLASLHRMYHQRLNAPMSSSVGRLFDAMASLEGLKQFQSYEGEAGLACEKAYVEDVSLDWPYQIDPNGAIRIDIDPLSSYPSTRLMHTLIAIILDIARREQIPLILSGGVFQNQILLSRLLRRLEEEKIVYYTPSMIPPNDGGIALGQLYYAYVHPELWPKDIKKSNT